MCKNSFSQNQLSFEHFSSENGLSSDQISCITQDRFGFLWIGTSDGLNRFDGKTFSIYRNAFHDSTSLSNNIVNAISADSMGNIWVATNGGLCYYSFSDDHFHHIDPRKYIGETLDQIRVYDVKAGKDHTVWFLTRTQLHARYSNGSIQTITLPCAEKMNLLTLAEDDHGNILIGTDQGSVLLFNEKTTHCTIIPVNNAVEQGNTTDIDIAGFYKDQNDSVWFGTWSAGMQVLTFSKGAAQINSLYDSQDQSARKKVVLSITSFGTSQVCLATYGSGISIFNKKSGEFVNHFRHDPSDAKSLSNDYVNVVFTDAFGTLWVGTNAGLDKYDPFQHQFSYLAIPGLASSSSLRQRPSDIIENESDPLHQTIWIAVPGAGLFLYNRITNHFKLFSHSAGDVHSLPGNDITLLSSGKAGQLLIALQKGLYVFDEKKKSFRTCSFGSSSDVPSSVSKILEDHHHRLWFSSYNNGVYCYNTITRQWISFHHDEKKSASLPDNHVFCIYEDHERRIWVGTQNQGLGRLDESSGTWVCYRHEEEKINSLPDNNVYDLIEDNNHQLWIATENGLAVMNLKDFTLHTFTTADGLSNNDIFAFQFDQQQHLWLATNNGLCDFDPVKKIFKNYYTSDGLQSNFIGGAFRIINDGTILIGTPGGVNYFNPALLKINQRIPEVAITGFNIFDKPVSLKRNGINPEPIRLTYLQNMITFQFAALNFTDALSNSFAYKLEGFDHNWIYCGNRNSATYTNLNGGHYIFKVKAANNDGVWNEAGASVALSVTTPFWKTWWFYLLGALFVVAMLYVIYRIRIRQIHRLQLVRQRIARDLHDDIGSTLSSITMMSQMATASISSTEEKPKELLKVISKASRQAMDLMGDIVWSVNPENDRLENIIIRMREYASEMLDAAHIEFNIDCDPLLQRLQLSMNQRKDFFLVYKEAINNLAKYSRATQATIQLAFAEHELKLTIADNGMGFDPEKSFSGNGLKNMKARAKFLRAKFHITSVAGKGTQLFLAFRISHEDGIAATNHKK